MRDIGALNRRFQKLQRRQSLQALLEQIATGPVHDSEKVGLYNRIIVDTLGGHISSGEANKLVRGVDQASPTTAKKGR
jgi:hypothetical protein